MNQHGIAVDLIVKAAKSTVTKQAALDALKAYAAGEDGVLGTADDRIDPNILDALSYLLEMGVAQKIIDLVPGSLCRKFASCF